MASPTAAEEDDDALFARLAELERAEEAAEAAGHRAGGSGDVAEPFMPVTPAQQQQTGSAAASHPRLSQLGRLQRADATAPVKSDVLASASAGGGDSLSTEPALQGLLRGQQRQYKQRSGGADAQQAADVSQDRGERGSAAGSPDADGVGAVGNRLRRVSWADDPGSGGAVGGA